MDNLAKRNIPITIADILIELTNPLSPAELGIEQRLGPFFGAPEKPLARVTLRWAESAGALVEEFHSGRAVPLNVHNGHTLAREDAANCLTDKCYRRGIVASRENATQVGIRCLTRNLTDLPVQQAGMAFVDSRGIVTDADRTLRNEQWFRRCRLRRHPLQRW